MNKANHILSAARLSLVLSLSFCTTESAELPPPPSSDSHGGFSSSSDAVVSSSSEPPRSRSVTVTSCPASIPADSFCDTRDYKVYKQVKIGEYQTWMAENLNYNARYSVCYSNNASNCDTYGRLYNWATAMNGAASSSAAPSGVQGVCPTGWHLPSDAEWDALNIAVGGTSTAGRKLKATSGWSSGGTDEFGFSALPGGYGRSDGNFINVGRRGFWWSATEKRASRAWGRYMDYYSEGVNRYNYAKGFLFSVRCVQD